MFKGVLIDKNAAGYQATLAELGEEQLPAGEVTVAIDYSTMNYKDGLAITGQSPVVRSFPMVPGVDLSGSVTHSVHPEFHPGDRVVLNGWGVGEMHWGGLAQKGRFKGDWLLHLPETLTTREAMIIGTAGYTAMLAVIALEQHGLTPDRGEVVVTGAAGGVGSVAILLLAKLGYTIAAVTGRPEERDYLTALGAKVIIDRKELAAPGKPLGRERWAGAIDAVGGHVLANVCAAMRHRGVVAACGLAGGMAFPATVAPFILRGVTLVGIDSVLCPRAERAEAWRRLAADLNTATLAGIAREIGLAETIALAPRLLAGQVRGRTVVDVNR
ncbi:MAG: oxidoreductase [Magnetococcales bacterium]|nr:oxidoreductase [Magnetococcales bacterium]